MFENIYGDSCVLQLSLKSLSLAQSCLTPWSGLFAVWREASCVLQAALAEVAGRYKPLPLSRSGFSSAELLIAGFLSSSSSP
jgi:hypothetical protein